MVWLKKLFFLILISFTLIYLAPIHNDRPHALHIVREIILERNPNNHTTFYKQALCNKRKENSLWTGRNLWLNQAQVGADIWVSQEFECEEKDYKFYSEFNRRVMKRSWYGRNMCSLFLVLVCTLVAVFWINWRLIRKLLRQPDDSELEYSSLQVINVEAIFFRITLRQERFWF